MSEYYEDPIRRLIRLDLLGILSPLERKRLEGWVNESEEHNVLYQKIRNEFQAGEIRSFLQTDTEKAWERIRNTTFGASVGHPSPLRKWLRYAAIVVPVVLAVSLWYVWETENRKEQVDSAWMSQKLLPVLTLDNGEKYDLKPEGQIEIEVNEGVKAYNTGGRLVYDTTSKMEGIRYNYIQVPKGSEYQVVLADGTKVWLNAASELKYPVAFNSNERKVYLKGEAYFEVTSDETRPFYVETEEIKVRVLGTTFDINTHYTKGVRTVLVEGSVVLGCGGQREIRMKPGELVDFNRTTSEVLLKQVDVMPYISWKEGFFVFEDETLEEILNTLALWYDKEVLFLEQKNRTLHFSGHLKRYASIETILSAITDVTGVKFQINEKVILIR